MAQPTLSAHATQPQRPRVHYCPPSGAFDAFLSEGITFMSRRYLAIWLCRAVPGKNRGEESGKVANQAQQESWTQAGHRSDEERKDDWPGLGLTGPVNSQNTAPRSCFHWNLKWPVASKYRRRKRPAVFGVRLGRGKSDGLFQPTRTEACEFIRERGIHGADYIQKDEG